MSKLKVLELFGGIGAPRKALERLGIGHEVVDYVEIDKYAVKSYNAIYNENFEPQDICEWDKDIEVDLIFHGSPCQDFSIAGKQVGGDKDSGTRSSLMYETIRIVEKLKPKYVIWENVKNVISKKHRHNFDMYLEKLESLGYTNQYQVLNAKDYRIPQNRERVFVISIRKDIEREFEFPPKQKLELKLKDMLEDEVDEKYYLSEDIVKKITNRKHKKFTNNNLQIEPIDYRYDEGLRNRVDKEIIPTLTCKVGTSSFSGQPLLKIKEATKKGYKEAYDGDSVNLTYPDSETRRGRVGEQVSQTLKTSPDTGVVVNDIANNNLLLDIFDLCGIIDIKEKDKYERSRELLQILWQEIGKKEIWEEIRRFVSIQEKEILQSNLYENGIYEDRKLQSKVSTSTSNSSEYNESITNREEMLNMWEDWKTRYTPQRWELSEQQFRQFNLFMQELSYETTQRETSMQNMWQTNERFRILQQTLLEIQEIWRPIENKISNGLRVRKLTPRETFRLMGFDDVDFEKAQKVNSNTQLYKQAGNSIVVNVLEAIFKELFRVGD